MNDAQRKAMERAIETIQGMQDSLNGYAGNDVITALRAQLDAPGEKVEPVAWETAPQVQWRNIRNVVNQIAKDCFGGPDHPQYGSCFLAVTHALTAKDGSRITLEPLPTAAQIAAQARAEAIEECAKVCDNFAVDKWNLYKGRPPYTGNEEGRADPHVEGMSDGADECATAIRALSATNPTEGEKG